MNSLDLIDNNIGPDAVLGNNTYKVVIEGHSLEIACPTRGQEGIRWCIFTKPSNETSNMSKCILRIREVEQKDAGAYRLVSLSSKKSRVIHSNFLILIYVAVVQSPLKMKQKIKTNQ